MKYIARYLISLLGSTVLSEFLSRGMLWARVLILGILIPADDYGLILIFLSLEGIVAGVTSNPFIKDILIRQDLSSTIYWRFAVVFSLVALPLFFFITAFSDFKSIEILFVIIAAFFNAFSQIGLYVLRVADTKAHNRSKMMWSMLTTFFYLLLLPIHWAWLPFVYMAGLAWVFPQALHAAHGSSIIPAYSCDLSHHIRGWFIYGAQALLASFPQHGVRLAIATMLTVTDVVHYTQIYMLATALFFIYSAMMISVEPTLSRAATPEELRLRFPVALKMVVIFVIAGIFHYLFLLIIDEFNFILPLLKVSLHENHYMLVLMMIFAIANGIYTIANALALAASGRIISLLATVIGAASLAIGLLLFIPAFGMPGVGIALMTGQLISVTFLVAYTIFWARGS